MFIIIYEFVKIVMFFSVFCLNASASAILNKHTVVPESRNSVSPSDISDTVSFAIAFFSLTYNSSLAS